jgi:hypothetical protein
MKAKKKIGRKKPRIYTELEHKVNIYKRKDAWEIEHQNKCETTKQANQ